MQVSNGIHKASLTSRFFTLSNTRTCMTSQAVPGRRGWRSMRGQRVRQQQELGQQRQGQREQQRQR